MCRIIAIANQKGGVARPPPQRRKKGRRTLRDKLKRMILRDIQSRNY